MQILFSSDGIFCFSLKMYSLLSLWFTMPMCVILEIIPGLILYPFRMSFMKTLPQTSFLSHTHLLIIFMLLGFIMLPQFSMPAPALLEILLIFRHKSEIQPYHQVEVTQEVYIRQCDMVSITSWNQCQLIHCWALLDVSSACYSLIFVLIDLCHNTWYTESTHMSKSCPPAYQAHSSK